MAETMTGLFGPSPYEIQQQRMTQLNSDAQAFANQNATQRAVSGMYKAGGMLGGIGAQAMGMVDPAVANAQRTEQIMGQGDADLSSSAGMYAKAKQFMEGGDRVTATKLLLKANEMKKQEATMASQAAKDALAEKRFTEGELVKIADKKQLEADKLEAKIQIAKDKLAQDERDGKRDDATRRMIAGMENSWRMAAVEARKAAAAAGSAESKQPITYVDDKGNAVWGTIAEARGKAAAVYDPNTRALVSGAQAGGKSGMEMSVKDYGSAQAAKNAIPKVQALIAQVEKGDVTTGSMADMRLGFAKMKSLLGGTDAAKNATDTEIAETMMGSEVFPLIQSLGIGAKGMDTPAERDFMRGVLTGRISLEKGTILNMAKRREAELNGVIQRWDTSVDSGTRDEFFNSTRIPKAKFGAPSKPADDKFVTGKQYKDAKGNVATYLGNGQWK
jgi:hypothetical protein